MDSLIVSGLIVEGLKLNEPDSIGVKANSAKIVNRISLLVHMKKFDIRTCTTSFVITLRYEMS